jgi:hypothetical protein
MKKLESLLAKSLQSLFYYYYFFLRLPASGPNTSVTVSGKITDDNGVGLRELQYKRNQHQYGFNG